MSTNAVRRRNTAQARMPMPSETSAPSSLQSMGTRPESRSTRSPARLPRAAPSTAKKTKGTARASVWKS